MKLFQIFLFLNDQLIAVHQEEHFKPWDWQMKSRDLQKQLAHNNRQNVACSSIDAEQWVTVEQNTVESWMSIDWKVVSLEHILLPVVTQYLRVPHCPYMWLTVVIVYM